MSLNSFQQWGNHKCNIAAQEQEVWSCPAAKGSIHMNDQQRVMQRFWYTAPSGEGFRNCALTDGLREDSYQGGAQIRALERYARYNPPDGIARDDASIFIEAPDLELAHKTDAPISLSLIEIRNPEVLNSPVLATKLRGRVLVNKMYLGKAGANSREGNVFIDLLANLPDGFSACEALALWRATDFWQMRYIPAHTGAIKQLPQVELPFSLLHAAQKHLAHTPTGSGHEPLRNPFAHVPLTQETATQLTEILTFLIHAYLLQQQDEWPLKDNWEIKHQRAWQDLEALKKTRPHLKKREEKEREYKQFMEQYHQAHLRFKRIYVAAEDDRLAYCLTLLARLFQDIPALLLPLTFSTYEQERDVLKSECLIIGTSPSRTAEKEGKKLDRLLPLECGKLGYVYNTYDPACNTPLPHYLLTSEQPSRQEPLRVEAVARYLARKLIQPGERFTRHLQEVAECMSTPGMSIPAQFFVSFWQQKLVITDLLRKPYLRRNEVTQLLQDQEWREFLEEPEISRQVFQWVIADCKGLDLEQPASSRIRHPQMTEVWQAQRQPDAHTLPEQIKKSVAQMLNTPGGKAVVASLAMNLRRLLEEYADNLAQPGIYGQEIEDARQLPANSEHPCFDVITACKRAQDPQIFKVLLNALLSYEQLAADITGGAGFLRYLFSTRLSAGQKVFAHQAAGAFVLRHLYDQKLTGERAEEHWHIHFTLLNLARRVLTEHVPDHQLASTATPLELVTPLLQFPLKRYWFLCGDDTTRQRWYLSWRKEVLMYQINQLQSGESQSWFNGQHWERPQISARDTQECYTIIRSHWQTHFLLVNEAIDCLDEWEHAQPLFDEQSPPFQQELLQQLETPPQVKRIQSVIRRQTETGQSENKEVVVLFYQKLLQGGYTQANTRHLLGTWHESWKQGYMTNEELHDILAKTMNLSQDALRDLLLTYKEEYKQRKAEKSLVYLYDRYLQQVEREIQQEPNRLHTRSAQSAREEAALQMLLQLLDGNLVSQHTLDGLLPLASLNHLQKVEFFAWYGRTYLQEYFKQSTQKRSTELLGLFGKLIAEEQAQQNQTLRPGQLLPAEWRKVILAIFWLWLGAAGDDEIVELLFKRVNPQAVELLFLLATFGGTYMTASRATLKALCQQYFQQLSAHSLTSAEKLLLCLNLLPPESFPFMPRALSVEDALEIFQIAALKPVATPSYLENRPLVAEVRFLFAQQELQPEIHAQILASFLQKYGCKVDGLSQHLQTFQEQNTRRVHELVMDVEMFQRKQTYRSDYAASEMELFLEIQEHRVKGNYPPEVASIPQAVYLRYYQSDKNEAELADPFKKAYLRYLQEFSNEDFTTRQGSLELLNILAGAGAIDKSIDGLANGLLVVRDFLQTCQDILHRQREHPNKSGEEEEVELSNTALRAIELALQQIQQAGLRAERYQQLVDQLILAIAPCVSDQSDVSRVCKFGAVLGEPQKKNPEFALFLRLSQQASMYYRMPEKHQLQPEWFAPYLETLPLLRSEFGITRDVKIRRNEIMQALLFVQNEPEEQTLLALDAYLQRAANGKLLRKVVTLWEAYKTEDPRIESTLSTARKDSRTEEQEETAPAPVVWPMDINTPPFAFVSREQELVDRRISWSDSFKAVRQMRRAIRRVDRQTMQELWKSPKTYYILLLYQRQIGRTYWQRFLSLRQLDIAYQDLLANISSPDAQKYKDHFFACAEACLKLEKRKLGWRPSLSPEQKIQHKIIRDQHHPAATPNRPAGG
jgi:hypothetical protein